MRSVEPSIRIRPYERSDAGDTLRIFQQAIMVTAAADYTHEQVLAWARPEVRDLSAWDRAMLARRSYVALIGEDIAGFSDVSADGYVDMMFVSPRFARLGVARELLDFLERSAREGSTMQLSANVSITARPFFEAMGFRVEAEQHPVTGGVIMTNFHMVKAIEY